MPWPRLCRKLVTPRPYKPRQAFSRAPTHQHPPCTVQVPRLTTLLRALVADQAGPSAAPHLKVDVGALAVARGAALEGKRAAAGVPGAGAGKGGAGGGGASPGGGARSAAEAEESLLEELFGSWKAGGCAGSLSCLRSCGSVQMQRACVAVVALTAVRTPTRC